MALRRVLIISPHFPPVNAPDMQRARLALPFLRETGWEPVVLCLDPTMVEGAVIDPLLERTYPRDIRIVRVKGFPPKATRWAGFGNLWLRCGRAFARAGERLLQAERFDLVFFTTTQFSALGLGPKWLKRFGVPYVLDYQDPWINPYYRATNTRPPGGWAKFRLSQWYARMIEPSALRHAAAVIGVSDSYGQALANSYPWFDPQRLQLLPFGASSADFTAVADYRPEKPLVPFGDGNSHHVYAGRCGPDMTFAMSVLFRAFKLYLRENPAEAKKIRFHFIGTDYAPPPLGRAWALPIAAAEGVTDYVNEHCYRVKYFDALYYLSNADALVGVGSNDPTYAASKIFPYVVARRPLVLIYHERSLVLELARRVSAGVRFQFSGPDDIDILAGEVHQKWFASPNRQQFRDYDAAAFQPYTAAELTRRLGSVFDKACALAPTRS